MTPTSDPSRTESTMPAPCRKARVRVLQLIATVVDRPPLLAASWLHECLDVRWENSANRLTDTKPFRTD